MELNEQTPIDIKVHTLYVHDFVPYKWTVWRHRNGNEYVVYDITNATSNKLEKYPTQISYYNMAVKTKFSRKAKDWVIDIAAENWSFEFVRHCTPEEIASLKEELWNV